jgi:hypothetical protein
MHLIKLSVGVSIEIIALRGASPFKSCRWLRGASISKYVRQHIPPERR